MLETEGVNLSISAEGRWGGGVDIDSKLDFKDKRLSSTWVESISVPYSFKVNSNPFLDWTSWTLGKTKRAEGNPDQSGDSLWCASKENPPKNFSAGMLSLAVSMSVSDNERVAAFFICSNLCSPEARRVIAAPKERERGCWGEDQIVRGDSIVWKTESTSRWGRLTLRLTKIPFSREECTRSTLSY